MPTPSRKPRPNLWDAKGLGEGVFYDRTDCAGILRRFAVLAIDGAVVLVLCGIADVALLTVYAPENWVSVTCLVLAWAYLAPLKTTRWGTLGYHLMGVRLVNLHGEQPTIWRATLRFLFLAVGPLNLLIDPAWVGNDPNRQAFRDKIAGTYVIRRGAVPAGSGPIKYPTYFFIGMAFTLAEVQSQTVREGTA